MKLGILGCCLLTVLAFSGCGGGGGSSNNTPAPFALATQTRTVAPGDSWTYSVTGSGKNTAGTNVTVTGTVRISVTTATLGSSPVLALASSHTYVVSDGSSLIGTTTVFFTQDAQGNIIGLGDDQGAGGTIRTLIAPSEQYPGTWSPTSAFSTTQSFTNGDSQFDTFAVVGSQVVSVPVGSFTTWQANETTMIGTSQDADIIWFAPEMGMFVKATEQGNLNGALFTLNLILTSTNVPLH